MGILIRAATLKDKHWIRACALEQAGQFYPELRGNRDKIDALIIDCISSPAHYAQVLEQDGKLKGCLLAMVLPNSWAERMNAHILLWVSTVPTEGARLLRQFREWMTPRRAIKVAGLTPDFEWDERIGQLVERIGFEKRGASYVFYN